MGRVNQGQTQPGQIAHDETEGGTSGNPHSNSASFEALQSINATGTESSTISTVSPAAVEIEATVQLFLQDKNPRGEALLEFMMESQPISDAIAGNESMMYVIHNESIWDGRNGDPTPDNFDAAYTSLPTEVAACAAYVERFLSDYTAGQTELDNLLDVQPVANDISESASAMHVIQEGDAQTDLQDYRLGSSSSSLGLLSLTSTNTSHDLNQTSYNAIPWDTVRTSDGPYTKLDAYQVEIGTGGTYRIAVTISHNSNNTRVNPKVRLRKNGNTILDGAAASGYVRATDGHNDASSTMLLTTELSSGDTLEVISKQDAANGTVTMNSRESLWSIELIS